MLRARDKIVPSVHPRKDRCYALDGRHIRENARDDGHGSVDRFPAFEAYAQLHGGPVVRLLAADPSGDTVWSLAKGTIHAKNTRKPDDEQRES